MISGDHAAMQPLLDARQGASAQAQVRLRRSDGEVVRQSTRLLALVEDLRTINPKE